MKTTLRLIILFTVSLLSFNTFSQTSQPKRCGTIEYYNKLFKSDASFERRLEINRSRFGGDNVDRRTLRILEVDDTITVVVHVVGSTSMQNQVTNAIIQSQIDVLNEDYQGRNADSVRIPGAFKPLYGKSKLTFALAGTNPYGEPTNGINRITNSNIFTLSTIDNAKFTATGGFDAWDPTKYLNIWIVSFEGNSVLGSSVFPGDPRDLKYHGFVCDYRAFGRGAPYLYPQYTRGRTTTHELGHFFNLQHTWGDDGGACSGTDFPNDAANDDTPNQANNTNGNPDPLGIGKLVTDNCSPNFPGVMYQNFMDYTDDSALVMFTKGQQKRMENTLSNAIDRIPLLNSTAYKAAAVFANDAGIRKITSPVNTSCANFKPVVLLRNSGTSILTSVKIVSVLNNGTPSVYSWSGTLSPYSETTVTLPTFVSNAGTSSLTIYTIEPNGATDPRKTNDTSKITFSVIGITPLAQSFTQNFTNPQFPPAQWSINNPDQDMTWERNASIGKNAVGSAWFNDWNNSTYHRFDDLITPNFSYTAADSVLLYFNVAAALYSNAPGTDIDTLTVLVTKDCGNSFSTVYKKWGDSLQTVGPGATVDTEFFPTTTQWRRDTINLRKVLGQSEPQFQVYFRISGNFENNIFLDDISIITKELPPALLNKGYLVYPSVFRQEFSIFHYKSPNNIRSIAVFNSVGQAVWRQEFNGDAANNIAVNLQGVSAGVYFVRIKYDNGRSDVVEKIIKQ